VKRILGTFLVVFLVGSGVLALNLFIFFKTPYGEQNQIFEIKRGTPVNQIIQGLEAKGVISNAPFFKAFLLFKRAAAKIRAGDYLFEARLTPKQVLALLMKGDFVTHRITIPEGWTARQIADYLEKLHLVNSQAFLEKCSDVPFIRSLKLGVPYLEGYLFPDTYDLYQPKNEEQVLRKFVERFREIYQKQIAPYLTASGLSEYDLITLASIVEKETGKIEERPLIAAVLLNRLRKNMPLAADPVVIYGISNFNGNLTRKDLETAGPYNAYLNVGLPPTPISNPGLASLRAVLHPAQTDYLYFVSKNDGTHYFSTNFEEHSAAVRKYQLLRHRDVPETLPETFKNP